MEPDHLPDLVCAGHFHRSVHVRHADGNHVGHVEDIWLVGFALLVLGIIVRDIWMRRRGLLR